MRFSAIPAEHSCNVCVRTYRCYFEIKDNYKTFIMSPIEGIPDHTGRRTVFRARHFALILVHSRAPVLSKCAFKWLLVKSGYRGVDKLLVDTIIICGQM